MNLSYISHLEWRLNNLVIQMVKHMIVNVSVWKLWWKKAKVKCLTFHKFMAMRACIISAFTDVNKILLGSEELF